MATTDPREAGAITDEHLAEVTEATVMDLVQGANFLVHCPDCEAEWAMAVAPMFLAGLMNAYGRAVDDRFRKLAWDIPLVRCGDCVFLHGGE